MLGNYLSSLSAHRRYPSKYTYIADSICPPNPTRFLGHELFLLFGRLAGSSGHVARSSKDLRQLHRKQFHPKGHRVLRQFHELWDRAREQQGHPKISRLVAFPNPSPPLFSAPARVTDTTKLIHLEGFDSLADLIASYTLITRRTHLVFVPGPQDLTVNSVLPRKHLLSSFTARLRAKIPNIHLASNPCRIKFFGQEIVVYRDDVMSRMLRHLVGVKPDARNEDLKRYVCFFFLPSFLSTLLFPSSEICCDHS